MTMKRELSREIIMTKKIESTYDEFIKSLTPQQKKEFEREYKDLLFSELLIAIMEEDEISVRKLAKAAGISPTVIQGLRSGSKKNITMNNFLKILKVLGCSLVIERKGCRVPVNLAEMEKSPAKKQ